MFKKFKEWLLKRELKAHNERIEWLRNQCSELRKNAEREKERAKRNYENCMSAWGEVWPLKRKLERARAWNQKTYEALKKAKEQSRRDHEYAEQQKQRIEDLKAEIAHLWEGKEEIFMIRVDDEPICMISSSRTLAEVAHKSDCAVHNGPAYPAGPCDCK